MQVKNKFNLGKNTSQGTNQKKKLLQLKTLFWLHVSNQMGALQQCKQKLMNNSHAVTFFGRANYFQWSYTTPHYYPKYEIQALEIFLVADPFNVDNYDDFDEEDQSGQFVTEGPILGESGGNFDTRDQIVPSLHFTLFLA